MGNEIQGESQIKDSKHGRTAYVHPKMLSMVSLAALDFIPRFLQTNDVRLLLLLQPLLLTTTTTTTTGYCGSQRKVLGVM